MKLIGGILFFFLLVLFAGCEKHETIYPYQNLEYSYYDTLRNSNYAINAQRVKWYIDSLRIAAHDTTLVDLYTDKYYAADKPYIWIDIKGADSRLDTLKNLLATIDSDAVNIKTVFQPIISRALQRVRDFDFTKEHNINLCLAEIEYFSTKGLLRMASGLRYGFVNPYKLMNRLDLVDKDDTLCTTFRTLYDTPTETPNKKYLSSIVESAINGKFPQEINAAKNTSKNYCRLRREFARKDLGVVKKRMLAVNMERYRWRTNRETEKFVWINLPEFTLRAIDESTGEKLEMKVCEGSLAHKTPLMTSAIERLELNPVWTVPQSIISREIAPKHAEDAEYFERNKMKVIDKSSGDEVDPETVSAEMLKSGNFNVIQNKGEGNSLGRMIFRFKNNFAIFLHDTPNRDAFNKSFRALSHGCVRLENPFALAVFLLDEKDPLVIDKMRIAIDMPPETEEGKKLAAKEGYKPIGLKTFKPSVPLYITYFTAYPNTEDNIVYTADPYGYDDKIISLLRSY